MQVQIFQFQLKKWNLKRDLFHFQRYTVRIFYIFVYYIRFCITEFSKNA